MTYLLSQYRPDSTTEREARLIFDVNGTTVTPAEGFWENTKETVGNVLNTRFLKATVNIAGDAMSGMRTVIYDAWTKDARTEELKDGQLSTVAEFARFAPPTLQRIITERYAAGERPSLEKLAEILDLGNWIRFFDEHKSSFQPTESHPKIPPTILNGPEGIFQSLPEHPLLDKVTGLPVLGPPDGSTQQWVREKTLFYEEFVAALIPLGVRNDPKFVNYFGTDLTARGERGRLMLAHDNADRKMTRALNMILGIEQPYADPVARENDPAFQIAKASLMHQYWRDGKRYIDLSDGTKARLPLTLTNREITADGKQIYRGEGLKPQFLFDVERVIGNDMFMGDPAAIANRLPPSVIKGALNPVMGVLEPEDIPVLRATIANRKVDDNLHELGSITKVRTKTKVIQKEQQRDAETIGEIYNSMSGFEKIALVSIAGYALANSNAARMGVGALGTLYFAQKFIMKQEDPLNDSWAPIVRGVVEPIQKMARGPMKKYLGIEFDKEKYTDDEMVRRTSLMESFLTERSRMDLNSSVAGLTILADMKLSELQSFFTTTHNGMTSAIAFWDPAFRAKMQKSLEDHGLDPRAAENFFSEGPFSFREEPYYIARRKHARDGSPTAQIRNPALLEFREEPPNHMITQNVMEAGDGLGTIFYMVAAKLPENKEAMRCIEYFRSTMGLGSYQDLPSGPNHRAEIFDDSGNRVVMYVDPQVLYAQLIRAGTVEASTMDISLMDFVASEMYASTSPVMLARREAGVTPVAAVAAEKPRVRGTDDEPPDTDGTTGDFSDPTGTDADTKSTAGSGDSTKSADGVDHDTVATSGAADETKSVSGSADSAKSSKGADDNSMASAGADADPSASSGTGDTPSRTPGDSSDTAKTSGTGDKPGTNPGSGGDTTSRTPGDSADPAKTSGTGDKPGTNPGSADTASDATGTADDKASSSGAGHDKGKEKGSSDDTSSSGGAADTPGAVKGDTDSAGKNKGTESGSTSPGGGTDNSGSKNGGNGDTEKKTGTGDASKTPGGSTDTLGSQKGGADSAQEKTGTDVDSKVQGGGVDTPGSTNGGDGSTSSPSGGTDDSEPEEDTSKK